jgi:hypothetical protein
MQHCDTSVTSKVLKFIGPSKDGRRQGRGTYLFSVLLGTIYRKILQKQMVQGLYGHPEYVSQS